MADCEEPAHGGSHKRPPTPFQCETEAVLNYIKQLRAENVSSVLVTHNLYHAYQVRDRFAVMSYGQKVYDVAKGDTYIEELT
jgi:simple sugar transport system ATP-binding protein